jgi:CheY-like chemotaxis protein
MRRTVGIWLLWVLAVPVCGRSIAPAHFKGMKKYKCVLLVDDSELDLCIGKAIIELSGITENIITAKNGIDAQNKLIGYYLNNSRSLPQLMLVDLVMPMLDGVKFIEEVMSFPGYARGNSKIIVLTASLESEDKKRLAALGVKDILLKPIDKTELLEILSLER